MAVDVFEQKESGGTSYSRSSECQGRIRWKAVVLFRRQLGASCRSLTLQVLRLNILPLPGEVTVCQNLDKDFFPLSRRYQYTFRGAVLENIWHVIDRLSANGKVTLIRSKHILVSRPSSILIVRGTMKHSRSHTAIRHA